MSLHSITQPANFYQAPFTRSRKGILFYSPCHHKLLGTFYDTNIYFSNSKSVTCVLLLWDTVNLSLPKAQHSGNDNKGAGWLLITGSLLCLLNRLWLFTFPKIWWNWKERVGWKRIQLLRKRRKGSAFPFGLIPQQGENKKPIISAQKKHNQARIINLSVPERNTENK